MTPSQPEATPLPRDPHDAARWVETRRRHRMMDGTWTIDLMSYMLEVLNADRSANIGRLSRAVNLLRSLATQVGSALYDSEPTVSHADMDDETASEWEQLLADSEVWQLAPWHGAMTWALRECAWRVTWSETTERPVVQSVTGDELVVECATDDPTHIVKVSHLRKREVDGDVVFAWDVYDMTDEAAPSLRVVDMDDVDITARVLGADSEWAWVHEGEPYMPWVLTHAAARNRTWDPYTNAELADLTFDVGVLWNLWHHVMRDASWRQKYGVGVRLAGAKDTIGGTSQVTTSQTSMLLFEPSGDGAGTIGAIDVGVDVDKYAEAIIVYMRTAAATLGLDSTDAEITTAAQSGVSIRLKRATRRRMAEAMEPQYRRSDEQLLALVAKVSNTFGETAYPVDGWQIVYQPPADSIDERVAAYEFAKRQVEDGLMSRIDWYRTVHPSATPEEARDALFRVYHDDKLLEQVAAEQVRRNLITMNEPEPEEPESEDMDDDTSEEPTNA